MKKKLYLRVSNDKYELPEIVADSIEELSQKSGIKIGTIKCELSRYYRHGEWCRFRKVVVNMRKEDLQYDVCYNIHNII